MAELPSPSQLQRELLQDMHLQTTETQCELWLQFLDLLNRWNKIFNLTAVRDPVAMHQLHLLDSLSVAPLPESGALLDVGSGGGLPGIPLAILYPERPVTLLDSNIKKIRFLRQAVIELKLHHVQVVHARVEDLDKSQPFQYVISRAFTALPQFITLTKDLITGDGALLAMMGKLEDSDLEAIPDDFVYTVRQLNVPGLDAARHLVTIQTP